MIVSTRPPWALRTPRPGGGEPCLACPHRGPSACGREWPGSFPKPPFRLSEPTCFFSAFWVHAGRPVEAVEIAIYDGVLCLGNRVTTEHPSMTAYLPTDGTIKDTHALTPRTLAATRLLDNETYSPRPAQAATATSRCVCLDSPGSR
jgi:hypothetical protein